MTRGARTPEELEALLEDAFIVQDAAALGRLFVHRAVLDAGSGRRDARGRQEIERVVASMWDREWTYIAEPRRVLRAGDTALTIGRAINVVRRGRDGTWRFAIAVMDPEQVQSTEAPR